MVTTTWDQKAGMTSPTDTDNLESYAEQAEAAKDAAAASEAAAAASAAAAPASEVEAESAEANAATSATTATTNAATATTKASEAATSATSASTSATAAQTAQTAAEAAETAASASEAAVAASAAAASTSETNAATSASAASTSETNAATSASAASTSATNAATSASAASTSATAAQTAQTAAELAETNAETAETNAAASATSANASALAALASEIAAGSSETNASTSATAAASSASSASASADAALAALDSFDDRYLGQKASDPTLDNDGNALVAGALYFNTTDGIMKVYDGAAWLAAYASLSGALLAANNLSDVLNAATARTNLGLGTAATTAATDYATAAQGALADSAVQPNDSPSFGSVTVSGTVDGRDVAADGTKLDGIEAGANVTDTANVTAAGALMDSEVTNLAQVKAFNSADYATAAQGALADSAVQPNDSPTFAGIDVTGTVTADGLTVDGNILDNAGFKVKGYYSNGASDGYNVNLGVTGNTGYLQSLNGLSLNALSLDANTLAVRTGSSYGNRLNVSSGGDISFYEDTGTTPKFFWDASAESLGVGTSSPSARLTVDGGTSADQLRLGTDPHYYKIGRNSVSGPLEFYGTQSGVTGYVFGGVDGERLRIDASGRVGIGTNSPSADLHIVDDVVTLSLESDNSNAQKWNLLSTYTNTGGSYGAFIIEDEAGSDWLRFDEGNGSPFSQFLVNGSEAMRIDASGSLLVGTTVTNLHTTATETGSRIADGFAMLSRSGGEPLYLNRLTSDGGILQFRRGGVEVGSIRSGGNAIQIGTANTGIYFADNIDSVAPYDISGGAVRDNTIDLGYSGGRFKDGHFSGTVNAANFNTTSDATLKTNVETLTGSLDAVNALRGVSFNWIENGGSEVGFIAQEVEEVLPEVVSTNDQGIKSVKYGNMVAVLVEAIKEQQLRIEALEAKR